MRNKIIGERKKLQFDRGKAAVVVVLFLMLTMAISLVVLPIANAGFNDPTATAIAAGMTWPPPGAANAELNASATRLLLWYRYQDKIPTWTYGVFSPNPVGVNQRFTIVMFNPQVPTDSAATNDIRYEYTITITKPDGKTETLPSSGTFVSDPTGSGYTDYTPDQVGNYSVTIKFNKLFYRWYGSTAQRDYYGVTLLESARTYTVVVQEEQVEPVAVTVYPLPTEYWTRPIEGQNQEWGRVSSNWLNNAKDRDFGSGQNRFQTEGIAPNSAHILWTKPTEDGGVVGGYGNFSDPGEVFNAGHQYQTRFTNQIIMHGRLYYEVPLTFAGGGGGWMCVDLRTGEDLWGGPRNFGTALSTVEFGGMVFTMVGSISPSFGYYYDWDDMNQHGIVNPGWMFTSNFAQSIHPRYGIMGQLNLTSVPSGFEVSGPKGEVLRYVMQNAGNSTNPDWRLLQWNSTNVFISQTGNIPANCPITPARPSNRYWNGSMWVTSSVISAQGYAQVTTPAYDWNVSVPICNTLVQQTPSIRSAILNDVLLLSNGTLPTAGTSSLYYHNVENSSLFAVSLKPDNRGQTMFGPRLYDMTFKDGSQNLFIRAGEGVFIMQHMPTLTFIGYSMYTGEKLWESAPQADEFPFGYYTWVSLMNVHGTAIAYGKLFTTGYTGHVFCYDLYNGTLLWMYEAPTHAEIFEYYTLFKGTVADGKIYIGTHEHSADTPLLKGNRIRCLNVTTGEEIWTMLGWAHPQTMAIADGILIYWNNYDHQVYAVGKGPSATTVSIQNDVTTHGNKVLVKGSVIDISAGTKQNEQAARFPNGVPAVSDASMGDWMEYVYMQKPLPVNVTGVEVIISVLDPNNNCYEVGRATSDANGVFHCAFTPAVPGEYTIYATFAGSESYWQSHAETALFVEEAPQPTPAPTPTPAPMTDTYVMGFGIAMVIAIVVIGLVIILMLRKR